MPNSSNLSENYEASIDVLVPGHLPGLILIVMTALLAVFAGVRFGPGFFVLLAGLGVWLRVSSQPAAKLPPESRVRIQLDGAIAAADWPRATVGRRSMLLPDTLLLHVSVRNCGEAWVIGRRSGCSAPGWRRLRVLWRLRDVRQ